MKKEKEAYEAETEDEDDEGMEVDEVEFDGKTYYHEESTGVIYDPETGDEVGKMVDGSVKLD